MHTSRQLRLNLVFILTIILQLRTKASPSPNYRKDASAESDFKETIRY